MKKYLYIIILLRIIVYPIVFALDSKPAQYLIDRRTFTISTIIHILTITIISLNTHQSKNIIHVDQGNPLVIENINIALENNLLFTGTNDDESLQTSNSILQRSYNEVEAKAEEFIPKNSEISFPSQKDYQRSKQILKKRSEAEKKKQQEELLFATMLKSVKKDKPKIPTPKKEEGVVGKGATPEHNSYKEMSITAIDAIRSKFIQCWTLPYGSKDSHKNKVTLVVYLDINANVKTVELINDKSNRYKKNPSFRAMADSAIRAVYKCSPLSGLPKEDYDTWNTMEIHFDPSEMF